MKQKMNLAQIARTMLCLSLIIFISFAAVSAQTTVFTYQGRFTDSTLPQPTNGTYQMQFSLFDAAGTPVGAEITVSSVQIVNGIFTVQLDFGANAFAANEERQLEIRVFNSATAAYVSLSPRQRLTSAPFAIRALKATTADVATDTLNVNGTPSDQIITESDTRLTDERTPIAGSANYIQNQTTAAQTSSSFNISNTGTANIFNARTQFNLGGNRVLTAFDSNLSIGLESGAISPFTGISNIFVGPRTGRVNTTGNSNLFFGQDAGASNTTGSYNLFFGISAGLNSTGSYNSFFGGGAGYYNLTGNYNTFIGYSAGATPVNSGSRNTLLGAETFLGSGTLEYATALGAGATVSTSNTVVLGRAADTVQIPGTLAVSTFSAATVNADTQFNIGGSRILRAADFNTFLGLNTGITGMANSFFGADAGRANMTGGSNSFFGSAAGLSNLTGSGNSFFGRLAGLSNTTGGGNSFFGLQAGADNTTGGENSFFGSGAGYRNTTGNHNSFFGTVAGDENTTGSNNVFAGFYAGRANKTGSRNTVIGDSANVGADNLTFASAFGADAVVSTSNTIVLGRADGRDKIRIFGLGTAGSTALCRNADNEISTCAPINLTEENRYTIEQINTLREQINAQQIVIDDLKKLVCANNPAAAVCQ